MSRRIVAITADNLSELPAPCRSCAFWEVDPVAFPGVERAGSGAFEKQAWVSHTLLEWGSCGQLAYVDGAPVGYVMYAPAAYVPRAVGFSTSPAATDAILLMAARIAPECRGTGLGRVLVQSVARETVRRGVRAIEAFGRTGAGPVTAGPDCVLPAAYLRAVGFKTVRHHPQVARLRLDIRSTVTWREDMESAIERLFGNIQSPVLSR